MANKSKKTPEKYEKFLASLRRTGGNIARAARAESIDRSTAYRWRDEDKEFAKKWDEAVQEGLDDLEEEARRRAFKGLKQAIFYKGQIVGYEWEYSDTLMIFLLKGGRPEKYKDRHELTGANGGAIEQVTMTPAEYKKLADERLNKAKETLEKFEE